MSLNEPLKDEIEERLKQAQLAVDESNVDGAVFGLLDTFAAISRDVAQRAWLCLHEAEYRDDRMREVEDEIVFQCLKAPLSEVYPEFVGQVEATVRDAFNDEHMRMEDPLGWAEMSVDSPLSGRAGT